MTDILAAGGLQTANPAISAADAAALLGESYGLTGQLRRLATEKDDTFRVAADDGGEYILKIANGAEERETVFLQDAILKHIAARDPGLPVPRGIADRSGQTVGLCQAADGSARLVRLLTFIAGTPLETTTTSTPERERIGAALARLRRATAGFSHAAEDRVLAWDVQHLPRLAPLLDHVSDPDQKHMLDRGLKRFDAIAAKVPALRRQVVHNDFSRSNLIVDHAQADFVSGIIDFGDTVRTAIAIDVSTAMVNQLPSAPEPEMLGAAFDLLRGYLAHADLNHDELSLLPHLIMGRIIARALITLPRARLFPDNATYILRNTPQGWHQLEWLLAQDPDRLSDRFLALAPAPAPEQRLLT
jgi:hydroxylysine kinase